MGQETNYIIDYLRGVNGMLSGRQKESHDIILKHAKVVHVNPISEILTPEQIERIKTVINPQAKECFKNAQDVVRYLGRDFTYVEGLVGLCSIGIEHAFNSYKGKYFDVTFELALGKDVTKEDYVSILEVTDGYDILLAQIDLQCYTALIPYFGGRKYLV